jgi:hypothetical protein
VFGHEAFHLRHQLLHLLAARLDVELGAAELLGVRGHHAFERVHEPHAQRIGALADDRRGLVPACPQRADALEEIRRRFGRGRILTFSGRLRQRFELGDQCFAIGLS